MVNHRFLCLFQYPLIAHIHLKLEEKGEVDDESLTARIGKYMKITYVNTCKMLYYK